MNFTEIDLFGVYVAPISAMAVISWAVTIGLRRLAVRLGLLNYVWHPAVFTLCVFVVVLSSITLVSGRFTPITGQ